MQPLGINIQVGTRFGWGIVALNLVLEFCRGGRILPVLTLPPGDLDLGDSDWQLFKKAEKGWGPVMEFNEKYPGKAFIVDFPVLYCGGNQFQHRMSVGTSGSRYSITVFENTHLGEPSLEEKNYFDKILAGSRWNADMLKANGFQNVTVWNQGVDTSLFHPVGDAYPDDGKFRIFSGGKLEFRKGQDLVVAAFRKFRDRHPDAVLITAWHSPWSELVNTLARSSYVMPPVLRDGVLDISAWLHSAGIPSEAVVDLGALPNGSIASVLRQCDAAVFPSRAEGATNLVAMEAIACGVPSVLSANTGHLDLLKDVPAIALNTQASVPSLHAADGTDGWGESDVEEILEHLEVLYQDRSSARLNAKAAAEAIRRRGWWHRACALEQECFRTPLEEGS